MKLCQKCRVAVYTHCWDSRAGLLVPVVAESECGFWAHQLLNAIADNYHAVFDFDPEGHLIYHPKEPKVDVFREPHFGYSVFDPKSKKK